MVPERAGSTLGLSHTLENNRPTMIQNREKTYRKSKSLLFPITLLLGILFQELEGESDVSKKGRKCTG